MRRSSEEATVRNLSMVSKYMTHRISMFNADEFFPWCFQLQYIEWWKLLMTWVTIYVYTFWHNNGKSHHLILLHRLLTSADTNSRPREWECCISTDSHVTPQVSTRVLPRLVNEVSPARARAISISKDKVPTEVIRFPYRKPSWVQMQSLQSLGFNI